jgi:hypothetical protein
LKINKKLFVFLINFEKNKMADSDPEDNNNSLGINEDFIKDKIYKLAKCSFIIKNFDLKLPAVLLKIKNKKIRKMIENGILKIKNIFKDIESRINCNYNLFDQFFNLELLIKEINCFEQILSYHLFLID